MELIRVKTEQDLQQCFQIRQEVFVREQGVAEDLEWDELDKHPEASHHMLLMLDGLAIGTARWYAYDDETAKLQRVAVLKPLRGIGAGQRLIMAMEDDAREAGYAYAMLDSQCQAEAFYKKLGYRVISEEPFLDAGILHVRMKKKL